MLNNSANTIYCDTVYSIGIVMVSSSFLPPKQFFLLDILYAERLKMFLVYKYIYIYLQTATFVRLIFCYPLKCEVRIYFFFFTPITSIYLPTVNMIESIDVCF